MNTPDAITQMAMQSWKKLNNLLAVLTEDQLAALIEAEKAGKRRLDILKRVFQRLQVLKNKRETEAFLTEIAS